MTPAKDIRSTLGLVLGVQEDFVHVSASRILCFDTLAGSVIVQEFWTSTVEDLVEHFD